MDNKDMEKCKKCKFNVDNSQECNDCYIHYYTTGSIHTNFFELESNFNCSCCGEEYSSKRKVECEICSATICEYCNNSQECCDDVAPDEE